MGEVLVRLEARDGDGRLVVAEFPSGPVTEWSSIEALTRDWALTAQAMFAGAPHPTSVPGVPSGWTQPVEPARPAVPVKRAAPSSKRPPKPPSGAEDGPFLCECGRGFARLNGLGRHTNSAGHRPVTAVDMDAGPIGRTSFDADAVRAAAAEAI